MEKGVTRIVFSKLIEIFIFLLFLGLLNFLVRYVTWGAFLSFTGFLNSNASLLIVISVVFMFAELLSITEFPSNVFGPILNFVGTWLLLNFVFIFLEAIQRRFEFSFLGTISLLKTPIFIGILSLTFVFGYLPIIYKLFKEGGKTPEKIKEPVVVEKIKIVPKIVEKEKTIKKKKKGKRGKNVSGK